MKTKFGFLIAIVGALALTPQQGIAASTPADASAKTSLTFNVVVTDKADRPVTGLQASDFKVLDNKQLRGVTGARMVSAESADASPAVQAILLVDMINTPFENLAYERKNIEDFLRQSGAHLAIPTSLVFLTETDLKFQEEPTRDTKVLLDNLENNPSLQRSFQPQGGMQQGVEMRQKSLEALNGLAMKLNGQPGRKLVIWISPGWPAFPHLSIQKSPQELDGLFNYIVGVSTILRQADITLYSVDPHGAQRDLATAGDSYYQEFLKGVPSAKQADNGDLFLQVIATETGGKVLYGSNNIAKMIDQCLADAQAFYVLSIDEPAASHANEFHGIQVQVNKPGMKARARTVYYLQP